MITDDEDEFQAFIHDNVMKVTEAVCDTRDDETMELGDIMTIQSLMIAIAIGIIGKAIATSGFPGLNDNDKLDIAHNGAELISALRKALREFEQRNNRHLV